MTTPSWEEMGFGSYPVTEISHFHLPLKDGIALALKLWLPCKADNVGSNFPLFANSKQWTKEIYKGKTGVNMTDQFPTVLEYLPYSKDSRICIERDHAKHSWFCSHGYVDMRIDMCGTGESQGYYFGEYDEREMDHVVEVIDWISNQNWSNGKVGMYGMSWGGFTGLQVAYKQLKALCTAISIYSTDDRFNDDIHCQGDVLVGDGTLSWSTVMMILNARPMHPRYFESIAEWKKAWKRRLEVSSQSWLVEWLSHQHKDDAYWKHGSICINPERVKCPILVIGGLADIYSNAALRMSATLNESSRTVIGPWSHQWPDVAVVGQNIDYLTLCLQWWDYHLKGIKTNDVLSWSRLSLFIRDSTRPDEICDSPGGKFFSLGKYDSSFELFQNITAGDNVDSDLFQVLYFGPSMSLVMNNDEVNGLEPCVTLMPHVLQGAGVGSIYCVGYGFPEDQSIANENSHCWISKELTSDLIFAGFTKVFVCVEAEKPGKYALYVRICDNLPGGESTLVTRGCQNLVTSEDGWSTTFPGGVKKVICIKLNGTGHKVEAGHRLLVSVTPTCYPLMYPTVHTEGLKIYPAESKIILQTIDEETQSNAITYPPPKPLLQLPIVIKTEGSYSTSRCNSGNEYLYEINETSGLTFFPSMDYEVEEKSIEHYQTDKKVTYGLIDAEKSIMSLFHLNNGVDVRTLVEVFQEMNGDAYHFTVKSKIKVSVDGEDFFNKTWENVISRKYV